jgi:RNA polymerase sporulation-specific sigma factor
LRHQTQLTVLARPKNEVPAAPHAELTLAQLLEQLPDPDTDVEASVVASMEAERLRRAVRALPVLERKVIVARYGLLGETLSCRQLAHRLGLSRSNVSAIEQRALERLRSVYGLPEAA